MRIKQNYLKAVLLAAPKDDSRHYLNGVHIEHNGIETRIVATDGNRIHAVRVYDSDAIKITPQCFIMPYDFAKKICAVKGLYGNTEISLTYEPNYGGGYVGCIVADLPDGSRFKTLEVDGKYPDYRRLIPAGGNGDAVPVDARYMLDAQHGLNLFLGKRVSEVPLIAPRHCENKIFLQYGDGDGDMYMAIVAGLRTTASSLPLMLWKYYL